MASGRHPVVQQDETMRSNVKQCETMQLMHFHGPRMIPKNYELDCTNCQSSFMDDDGT